MFPTMVLRYQSFRVILVAEPAYSSRGKELRLVSWAPKGRTEPVVQPATYTSGRFCSLGKGKREWKAGEEPRLATEEAQRQGAGRLFVARDRGTHKTPSPRKLTFYPTYL